MKFLCTVFLLVLTLSHTGIGQRTKLSVKPTIYEFSMTDIDGTEQDFASFEGDVLLIVNTASECGFTPQYASLEKLYQKYRDRGFRILAFPANNFGAQEPGTNAEIKEFCSVNYDVSFQLFGKISVKGEDKHPLYDFLTGLKEFGGEIKWNFTKFLISRAGAPLARFGTRTDPLEAVVATKIEEALKQ